MAFQRQVTTVQEFDDYIQRDDLGDQLFEFIGGEIVEVPSNPFASEIAQIIGFFIRLFLRENRIAGHVTTADGGFMVSKERYAPDVAYISHARQPELARTGYNPNPPELAVEVISDETNVKEQRDLRLKISNYLAAGTIVWVVHPLSQLVEIHRPGQPVAIIGVDDTLDGGAVLPGFSLAVSEIFSV